MEDVHIHKEYTKLKDFWEDIAIWETCIGIMLIYIGWTNNGMAKLRQVTTQQCKSKCMNTGPL
jgi:hypothetical protein